MRLNDNDNPAQITFASVTRPKNSSIIIPIKQLYRNWKSKSIKWKNTIRGTKQYALSKTIMVQGVSIDSLLENNLQDMKYNMSGIKSAITSEIDSFVTQTFAENDITELSIVGRARKHLKVVLASANMKFSIIQGARSNHPINIYINEYLTQKRSALL